MDSEQRPERAKPIPCETPEAMRAVIEALPQNTLFSHGWMPQPEYVQGSLYLRTHNGVRYVGPQRDGDRSVSSIVPNRFRQDKPEGVQIIAAAPSADPYTEQRGDEFAAIRALTEWDDLETAAMTNAITRGGHEAEIVRAAVALVNAIPPAALSLSDPEPARPSMTCRHTGTWNRGLSDPEQETERA